MTWPGAAAGGKPQEAGIFSSGHHSVPTTIGSLIPAQALKTASWEDLSPQT